MISVDANPYLVHFLDGKPNYLVAEFQENKLVFMEKTLRKIMENIGIQIPPSERVNYEMRTIVALNSENNDLFEKAFRNIYYRYHMPKDEYKWVAKYSGR